MSDEPMGQDQNATALVDESARQPGNAAAADMQAFLGRQLRAVYDDIAKQPIPDRFIELMKQLDESALKG